ncbi:hypothetical protein DFH07DRAFT_780346 [Mycena maculata]|uniref:Uncharacterized protein n=1 Tax=Mycena maculata TaxID=230809 RepID=A0AAD7I3Q5_9AGAR|nr:hypothetical protein DFH07DRAFT_780346 [Mycena maculata]
MPQFDQMVEHVLSRKSSVACQAVDPPGIGDLTDLYNVLCNEVPLANSTDLTMALIVGKVINKHRSTSAPICQLTFVLAPDAACAIASFLPTKRPVYNIADAVGSSRNCKWRYTGSGCGSDSTTGRASGVDLQWDNSCVVLALQELIHDTGELAAAADQKICAAANGYQRLLAAAYFQLKLKTPL